MHTKNVRMFELLVEWGNKKVRSRSLNSRQDERSQTINKIRYLLESRYL